MKTSVIALMTDFGEDDFFVPSLKGTILKINPLARIVDITHRVRSFDIAGAGFILFSCYKYFPEKTIFLIIVDPGVGTSRRILLAETERYFFIAPDNGVLSLVLGEEKVCQIREITNEKFFLPARGMTFEGRDRMAPAASSLSKGVSCEEFGPKIARYEKLKGKGPVMKNNEIIGRVLYTDKFGNLITDIRAGLVDELQERNKKEGLWLLVRKKQVSTFKQNYSSVKKGELLFLVGSLGLIEIAAREDSAAEKLRARVGDDVRIIVKRTRRIVEGYP